MKQNKREGGNESEFLFFLILVWGGGGEGDEIKKDIRQRQE